ncbi:MAG: hypothetical protein WCC64_17295 [Aliidongia sp.]
MSPIEMIRRFYEGCSIEDICRDAGWPDSDSFEMLLRGYILGLSERCAVEDDS